MVRLRIEFDDARLFRPGRSLVLTIDRDGREQKRMVTEIEEVRFQHGRWVAKVKDIDSISDAETWIGARMWIRQSEWPDAEPGSFFSFDLEGCIVFEGETVIGQVKTVLDYGGTALLQLEKDGKEILIPFARSFLKNIDTDGKRIDVELPEGLTGLNTK